MKLPINFLLYLASIGLAGGSAFLFYKAVTAPQPDHKGWAQEGEDLFGAGRSLTPAERRDDYSSLAWWETFKNANFVGKLPPKPVELTKEPEPTPVHHSVTPVDELVDVLLIAHLGEGEGRVVVRYKDGVEVEPPDEFAGRTAGSSAATAAPGPADVVSPGRPRPGRPGRNGRGRGGNRSQPRAPMPAAGPADARVHQVVREGETLWPPHDNVRLVRVQWLPEAVVFARVEGEAEDGTPKLAAEEKVFCELRVVDPAAIQMLVDAGLLTERDPAARAAEQETSAATPAGSSEWVDVGEKTRSVNPGEWHISRQDNEMIARDADVLFHQDVTVRSYSSRGGSVRGVQITKVSPRMERFGFQAGDVILSVNGEAVRSKAEGLSVGRRQYQNGARSFRVKILNRYGQEEERTYYVPNN